MMGQLSYAYVDRWNVACVCQRHVGMCCAYVNAMEIWASWNSYDGRNESLQKVKSVGFEQVEEGYWPTVLRGNCSLSGER